MKCPKRKPGESDEAYSKRLVQWLDDEMWCLMYGPIITLLTFIALAAAYLMFR